MIVIKDNAFDKKQFKQILDYLDPIILAERLQGNEIVYEVHNGGQNYMGYIHLIHFTINNKKGFNLYLYENQSLSQKGFIAFKVKDTNFNSKKEKTKIINLGFKKSDIKKGFNNWIIALPISNIIRDVDIVFKNYRDNIF